MAKDLTPKRLSRRDFLKVLGVAGGAALAACVEQAQTPVPAELVIRKDGDLQKALWSNAPILTDFAHLDVSDAPYIEALFKNVASHAVAEAGSEGFQVTPDTLANYMSVRYGESFALHLAITEIGRVPETQDPFYAIAWAAPSGEIRRGIARWSTIDVDRNNNTSSTLRYASMSKDANGNSAVNWNLIVGMQEVEHDGRRVTRIEFMDPEDSNRTLLLEADASSQPQDLAANKMLTFFGILPGAVHAESAPQPTNTAQPTNTVEPTKTAQPEPTKTAQPQPTNTAEPTKAPYAGWQEALAKYMGPSWESFRDDQGGQSCLISFVLDGTVSTEPYTILDDPLLGAQALLSTRGWYLDGQGALQWVTIPIIVQFNDGTCVNYINRGATVAEQWDTASIEAALVKNPGAFVPRARGDVVYVRWVADYDLREPRESMSVDEKASQVIDAYQASRPQEVAAFYSFGTPPADSRHIILGRKRADAESKRVFLP